MVPSIEEEDLQRRQDKQIAQQDLQQMQDQAAQQDLQDLQDLQQMHQMPDLQLMQQMLAKQVEVLQQLRRLLGGPAAAAEPAPRSAYIPPEQRAYIPPELRGQSDRAPPTSPQQESEQESTRCRYTGLHQLAHGLT